MKKNLYLMAILAILAPWLSSQGVDREGVIVAQSTKMTYRDTLSNSTLKGILDAYNSALKAKNQRELFSCYSLLCEQCVGYGDYEGAKEYAFKAFEIDKQLPVRKSISHLYALLYKALYDYNPSVASGYYYLDEALDRAKTEEDIFEANVCMADYAGRKNLEKTYELARSQYLKYATKENIQKHYFFYMRAEAYRYIFSNQPDSAIIHLNKIQNAKDKVACILNIHRLLGNWSKAILYADSTDYYRRSERYDDKTRNATMIEALVEKSNIDYARFTENYEIAMAKADIKRRMLLQNQILLESERAENESKELLQRQRARMYTMRLDSAKLRQQNVEMSHRKIENEVKAAEEEKLHVTLGFVLITILTVVLALAAIFMWVWVRSGSRMTKNMSALTAKQDKLRQEAEDASKGRDSFIKNMSKEMQIPLQQVSEYAKILADPNGKLTDDERFEYGMLVQEKSTMLIDNINSILNPDDYVTHESTESEYERIEKARREYQASLAVVCLFLVLSSVGYANRNALSEYFSDSQSYALERDTAEVVIPEVVMPKMVNGALPQDYIIKVATEELKPYVIQVMDSAYKCNYEPKLILPLLDKSIKKAEQSLDMKGHCLLLCMRMRSQNMHGTWSEFLKAGEELRKVAKQYGIMRFYYYTYKEEIERRLKEQDMFNALRILDILDTEKQNNEDKTAAFYDAYARMIVSRERDEPLGVLENANKALEINKELNIYQDVSQIYIELFRHTKGAVYSHYGDSLLNLAVKTANNMGAKCVAYLEKAFRAGTNLNREEYFRYIEKCDSLQKSFPIVFPREHIARSYKYVFKNDIPRALQEMGKEADPKVRYRFQLSLAKRYHLYKTALDIRDSLIAARAKETSRIMASDLEALRKMYGTDSLARQLSQEKLEALMLEEQQNQIAIQEQEMLLAQEQQMVKLRNAQMADYAHQRELQLQRAEIESQKIAINTMAAKAVADNVQAEKKRMVLYISVAVITIVGIVVFMAMLYAWRVRNKKLYKELAKKNREISEARAEAIAATERKDLFIQNMSHEIRTPLNAIAGFAQLLALPEDTFTNEEREKFAQHVEHNSSLLNMLIEDIVNIGNVERGTYSIECRNQLLKDIVAGAMATVEYRVPAGVKMIYKSSLPDDFEIYTDGRRVVQVLINYLTNAIKHIVEGSITISVKRTSINGVPTIRFAVADTGTGVPPEQRDRVFMRFVKLEKFVQGTGLGLSICRIIAEKMNGRCYLDIRYPEDTPNVDHGARFVFEIPYLEPVKE